MAWNYVSSSSKFSPSMTPFSYFPGLDDLALQPLLSTGYAGQNPDQFPDQFPELPLRPRPHERHKHGRLDNGLRQFDPRRVFVDPPHNECDGVPAEQLGRGQLAHCRVLGRRSPPPDQRGVGPAGCPCGRPQVLQHSDPAAEGAGTRGETRFEQQFGGAASVERTLAPPPPAPPLGTLLKARRF